MLRFLFNRGVFVLDVSAADIVFALCLIAVSRSSICTLLPPLGVDVLSVAVFDRLFLL